MATSESTPKINGRKLFDDIEAALRYFLVLKPAQYLAVSLWIIFTWVFHAEISPRLHFRSPEKRCGKSTALKVLSRLVCRPLLVSRITASALFRSIELDRPTVLIDEVDSFMAANNDMRNLINSGMIKTRQPSAWKCCNFESGD